MKKLLISTSASALFVAMGGAMAQTGDAGADMDIHAAADQITCEEIAGLDDDAATQVLYFVAGYQEGHRSGMEFGAAPDDQLFDDDDVAADLDTELDDDLAEAPDLDDPAMDDDIAEAPDLDDPVIDDDIAEAPDLDDPAVDDELAAEDPMVDPEITAAIGTEAEGIVGIDFDVQQVMTACAENPTMTVAAVIEQERGMGLAPEGAPDDLTDN